VVRLLGPASAADGRALEVMVMMRNARVTEKVYRRNTVVALVAMLYSVYAIFASGKDAVLGGMIVMGIGYVIYGFIAPRFVSVVPVALVKPRAA
jgi:putrescine:ornithine antiporter